MNGHAIGDLAEVLDNMGVFGAAPHDLAELCPSGFRRVPISSGGDYYLSLQAFAPEQVAFAHTHPDSEEWVMVLGGSGEARFRTQEPLPLNPGMVVGRAERHPRAGRAHPTSLSRLARHPSQPWRGLTTLCREPLPRPLSDGRAGAARS